MTNGIGFSRYSLAAVAAAGLLVATQQPAAAVSLAAPVLVAQTGMAKTAVGWVIVLLCIGLGLLVVCRPSARQSANGKRR